MTTFKQRLEQATAADREYLYQAPAIQQALAGQITRDVYIRFLIEAWHHVRHTVPLMMAAGSRFATSHPWLVPEVAHYIEEELGHDEWIVSDLQHCGVDAIRVRNSPPAPATDAMVGYAYDVVQRRNPVAFFGMVFVLEGTSVALALRAAEKIHKTLSLPPQALTYLRSHGELDQEHVQHLANILNQLDRESDQAAVVASARTFYWLYGNVFRSLPVALVQPLRNVV